MHKYGLINVTEADNSTLITVSMLAYALANNFDGYNYSSPCKFSITSLDPFPSMILHVNNSEIHANLSTELLCKHQPNDTEFSHIVNLVTTANIVYNLESVAENVTLKINVSTV